MCACVCVRTAVAAGKENPDYICGNIMEVGLPICFFPLNFQVNSPEQGCFKFLTALVFLTK